MPKTRKRALQAGAKSTAIRIKHKIGGRKSTHGLKQLSLAQLAVMVRRADRKDVVKIFAEWRRRGVYDYMREHIHIIDNA